MLGPHSNVLVVMVRGQFASWKQPVYFDFDTRMTAVLLNEIILALANNAYISCSLCFLFETNLI